MCHCRTILSVSLAPHLLSNRIAETARFADCLFKSQDTLKNPGATTFAGSFFCLSVISSSTGALLAESKIMNGPLNISAISDSLYRLQKSFHIINKNLSDRRDPLTEEIITNMLCGYQTVNQFFSTGIDPLEFGQSSSMLDLNQAVLGGQANASNRSARRVTPKAPVSGIVATGASVSTVSLQGSGEHERFEAASRYFYGEQGCISEVMEWLEKNNTRSVWYQAAGLFCQILSQPQLFIEGNHRTATLLMSFLLVRHGEPPCVLSLQSAKHFFEQASLIKKKRKHGIDQFIGLPKLTQIFANQLKSNSNASFLL